MFLPSGFAWTGSVPASTRRMTPNKKTGGVFTVEKNIIGKAEELLAKCDVVTLASINEEGYPRVCVISKIKTEGIRTVWMATGTNSTKTTHFRQNPKASLCYYLGGDSVTLLGQIEIVHDAIIKQELWQDWFIAHFPKGASDPEYCILRFNAHQATCWIEQCFETHRFS